MNKKDFVITIIAIVLAVISMLMVILGHVFGW